MTRVTVQIPPPLRPFADGAAQLEVEANDVGAALHALGAGREALLARVLAPEGELRPYVNVFVGERNIRRLDGLATRLSDGDVVAIIPAVAGGAPRGHTGYNTAPWLPAAARARRIAGVIMRQILARFAVVVLLLGVASCTGDGADYTWLRVVNAVPDSPTLTTSWDKYVFRRDVAFGNATAEGGESMLKSFGDDARITVGYRGPTGEVAGTLLTENVAIARDSTSTVIIAGTFDAPEAITLVSPRPDRPLAALTLQFVHAALEFGAVDIYVTAPDTELTSTAPIATLQPRGASSAIEAPFGRLRIRLTQAGTFDVLFDTGPTDFPQDPGATGPGSQWLITIAPNVAAGSSPLFLITTNGRAGTQLFDVDTSATLRAYHASRTRPAVDVMTAIDPEAGEGEETPPPQLDQVLYSGLAFRERSPLVPLPTGQFRLAFRESGAEEAAVVGLPRNFFAGTEYNTFLYRATEADTVIISDSSTRSIATEVRLRFAHMALGTQFLTFYLSETEAGATAAENVVIRDMLPGFVTMHVAGRPNDYFLTVTERFYTTAAEAANAVETVIFGPQLYTLAGGDVSTWVVFQGDDEDDPPVVLQFDDRTP